MVESLLSEPRVASPPPRGWRDWALFGAFVVTAIVETMLRPEITWRPLSLVVCLVLLPTLLWRRTHPLAMVTIVFGTFMVVNLSALIAGEREVGLGTSAFVLILVYALFRWGSGHDAAKGLVLMFAALFVGFFTDTSGIGDMIGGTIVLLFPAELGAIVRYQGTVRSNQVEQIKLQEREQLARELHDTVAHHISAISIQARAGRTLADSEPGAPVKALEVIELEASRTLAEMRDMVGALRRGDEPDLAPQRGVADIERLADAPTGGPPIHVEMSGDLTGLRPSLDAALYRLAQESITNAARHARHATRVNVTVSGRAEAVHLTVSDDGDTSTGARTTPGYGLIGLAERAKLLGGTMSAGPNPGRGWSMQAVLPRNGGPA